MKSIGNKSSSEVASLVISRAREKGLLLISAGEGTVRLVPPLNIPNDTVSKGLAILKEAIEDADREI